MLHMIPVSVDVHDKVFHSYAPFLENILYTYFMWQSQERGSQSVIAIAYPLVHSDHVVLLGFLEAVRLLVHQPQLPIDHLHSI